MTRRQNVVILAESAVMIALSTVLSMIKLFDLPQGGSVTAFSLLPLALLAYRRGVGVGVGAGFVYSVLQLLLGLKNVAWVPTAWGIALCVLLDYILPYTAFGLCGMFRRVRFCKNERTNRIIGILLGILPVMLFRYVCHILSGVLVWYALDLEWYADDPDHLVFRYGAWAFSAIYNGSFLLPETAITMVSAAALVPIDAIGRPIQAQKKSA